MEHASRLVMVALVVIAGGCTGMVVEEPTGSGGGGAPAAGGGSSSGGGAAMGGGSATGGGASSGGGTSTGGGSASGGGTAAFGGGTATGGGSTTGGGSATDGGPYFRPNPLISVGAPITSSASTASTVALAFDGRVDTGAWSGPDSNGPVSDMWVRIQLGHGTPCQGPSSILVVWHSMGDPDYTIDVGVNYNTPTGYTLETSPDGTQWTQVVNVSSTTTTYRARSHQLDFTGQCYLRFTVTQMLTGQGTRSPGIDELYVYDVSHGNDDTWLFLGDGPNRFAYDQHFAPSFADAVTAKHAAYTPAMLDAAELDGQLDSMKTELPALLTLHPGFDKWVLALGLDEASFDTPDNVQFTATMQSMIDQITAAGHQVLIPHLRYTTTTNYPHLAEYNAAIDQLVQTNHLVPAPDLYAVFHDAPSLLCSSGNDCETNWIGISPSDPAGYEAENAAWATALDAHYAP
jgi:hypothetical protein